jgi:PAS domain S-box-containing protein
MTKNETIFTEPIRKEQVIEGLCRDIFENANDAIFLIDARSLDIIGINYEAGNISGYSGKEIEGKNIDILHRDEDKGILKDIFKELLEKGNIRVDRLDLLKKDGSSVPVEISAKVIGPGERKVILAIVRDITCRIKATNESIKRNVELSALNEIGSTANSTLDLEAMLQRSLLRVCEATRMPSGCIFLLDTETYRLIPSSYLNIDDISLSELGSISKCECIGDMASIIKDPVLIGNLKDYYKADTGHLMDNGILSIVCVPILFRDNPLGVIVLAGLEKRDFTAQDVNFFMSIANTIGAAINNAGFFKEVQSQAKNFSLLFESSSKLTSTLNAAEIIDIFKKYAVEATGSDNCILYSYDQATGNLSGMEGNEGNEVKAFKAEGAIFEAIVNRNTVTVEDAYSKPGLPKSILDKHGILSYICTPVLYKNDVIAVAVLFSKNKRQKFFPQAMGLFNILVKQAEQSYYNAMTVEDLKKRNDELRRVYDIQRKISRSIDLDDTLKLIVDNVPYLLKLPYCAIFLLDDGQKEIAAVKASSSVEEKYGSMKFKMEELVASRKALEDMKPVVIENAPAYQNIAQHIVRLLDMKSVIIMPLIARNKKLGVLWLYNTTYPIRFDEEEVARATSLSDQIAIAIDNAKLFKELSNANTSLESSYEKLKELDDMKMEFFTLISHELRTPLTTIKGFTELLHDGMLGPLNTKQREKLGRIITNIDKITDIVTSLSDLTSIASKKYLLNAIPVSMSEIINEVVNGMEFMAKNKGIMINVKIPMNLPLVSADKGKIQQVVLNLIDNAIKYTDKGGEVNIDARDRGNFVLVSVQDTGIGIPDSDIEKIFSGFYHAGYKLSYEYKGPGLGLAISKGIIKSHGGNIWAESETGKGSTFYFTVPKSPPVEISASQSQKG